MYKILNKYKKFYNISSSIFFLLTYFLYYLSLEKCLLGFIICCLKINWIKKNLV